MFYSGVLWGGSALLRGSSKARTFGSKSDQELATLITSRKCYPRGSGFAVSSTSISSSYIHPTALQDFTLPLGCPTNWIEGSPARAAYYTDPTNHYIDGTVYDFNPSTRVLRILPTSAVGSGTYTNWAISSIGPISATSVIEIIGGEGSMVNVEYSLDGGAWASANGVWGTSKYIRVRGTSSASYETALSADIEIGGVEYLFLVTTKVDPMVAAFAHYSGQENYTETENYVD